MNLIARIICFSAIVFLATPLCAQKLNLNFASVTWGDDAFLAQFKNSIPQSKMVEQKYEVRVPYTEYVEVDGKRVPKTNFRTEQRTRKVPIQSIREINRTRKFSPGEIKVMTLDGAVLSDPEVLKRKFAKHRLVLFLKDSDKLTDLHRQVLNEGILVMHQIERPSAKSK